MTSGDISLDCPCDEGGDDDDNKAYQRIRVRIQGDIIKYLCVVVYDINKQFTYKELYCFCHRNHWEMIMVTLLLIQ